MQLSHDMPIRVGTRPTITVYNVLDIPNITNWWMEMMDKYYSNNKVWINHTHAALPNFLSLPILSKHCKDIVMERLWDKGPTDQQKQNWNQLCNYMNSSEDSHLLPKFVDFTFRLDEARGERFSVTVPEFASLMNTGWGAPTIGME